MKATLNAAFVALMVVSLIATTPIAAESTPHEPVCKDKSDESGMLSKWSDDCRSYINGSSTNYSRVTGIRDKLMNSTSDKVVKAATYEDVGVIKGEASSVVYRVNVTETEKTYHNSTDQEKTESDLKDSSDRLVVLDEKSLRTNSEYPKRVEYRLVSIEKGNLSNCLTKARTNDKWINTLESSEVKDCTRVQK